jgi:uncharacterized membrane protein
LPSLRSAAPSQDRKSENSNAHGITPVQNYICQRSFIIAVQMAKDMRQRIYLAVFMLLTYSTMSALGLGRVETHLGKGVGALLGVARRIHFFGLTMPSWLP